MNVVSFLFSFIIFFIGASLQSLHAVVTTTEVFIVVQVPLIGITDLMAESKETYKEVCLENKWNRHAWQWEERNFRTKRNSSARE